MTDRTRTVPVVVGVTGHRAIRPEDRPALYAAVKTEIERLRALCPHSDFVMLNSLAEGADLLCADVAEELGVTLAAALPRPGEDYIKDFSPEAAERFLHHCARAESVFVAPNAEPIPSGGETRDFQFRQAGIYVTAHCHVLLALWDGGGGTEAACGTAEAVDFALHGGYASPSGAPVRSDSNEAVIHVFTPRRDRTGEPAGTVHILGNREAVEDVLRRTDEFNRAAALCSGGASRLPEPAAGDPVLERMEAVSRTAGTLSRESAKRYRRILALLAAASAALTFAFLMYDEAQALWMILVCGLMLLAAWGCRVYASRADCHRRYIEYRALSECLRVQTYLRYAGSGIQAAELLSWTQQEETAWILDALCALTIGGPPGAAHEIRECWVDAQRSYHRQAAARSKQALRFSERTVGTALTASIALYCAAVVYELLCGGLIFDPLVALADPELWRTVLKIVLGTIAAVTLFIANYYGRLSLSRTRSDHEKMERFYEKMSARLQRHGQTEELLTLLAREELIENGNWCSYQRDNTPEFSI